MQHAWGKSEMCVQFLSGSLKGRTCLGNVTRKIILEGVLTEIMSLWTGFR
jgi:hypothetical protein